MTSVTRGWPSVIRLAENEEYWGPASAHHRDVGVVRPLFVAIKQLKPLEAPDPLPLSYEEHSEALRKLLYRAKNQQRVTKFWQHLQTLSRRLPSREDVEQPILLLSRALRTFSVDKKLKRLRFPSEELLKLTCESLREVQSSLQRLLQHCLQTAR